MIIVIKPFITFIVPSIVSIGIFAYIIKQLRIKRYKISMLALVISIVPLMYLFDTLFWVCSTFGLYKLPTSTGKLSDVCFNHGIGGSSSFFIHGESFQIGNEYNDILLGDKTYRVTYTPVTHQVYSIERLE